MRAAVVPTGAAAASAWSSFEREASHARTVASLELPAPLCAGRMRVVGPAGSRGRHPAAHGGPGLHHARGDPGCERTFGAWDLVRSARPQWLQTRGMTTVRQLAGDEGIRVYMDNARLGGVESLRTVALGSVEFLRFLDAPRGHAAMGWWAPSGSDPDIDAPSLGLLSHSSASACRTRCRSSGRPG